jgi:hypothetical protein
MKDDHCTCAVEVSPDAVDAGADITLKVQVASSHGHGLRGARISIRNDEGTELAQADLRETDDAAYTSDDIVLAAPRVAGECVYRAVVIAADKDGAWHDQASAEVRFVVTPHAAELNVWDVPPAIVAGERFKLMAGVRCSAGCCLADRKLSIVAEDGAEIGAANLGRDIWPGTDALYVTEIEGKAPTTAGTYQWDVRTAAWDGELPHDIGSSTISVRVVNPPDCEITVEAVDKETRTPIKGARVVVHPYRATTDENGVARIKVTKGHYDILVSASKYVAVSTTAEVTADLIARTELDADTSWMSPDEDPGY